MYTQLRAYAPEGVTRTNLNNYNLLTGQENEPSFLIVALIMVCLNHHWRV